MKFVISILAAILVLVLLVSFMDIFTEMFSAYITELLEVNILR